MEPFVGDWFAAGQAQRQRAQVRTDASGAVRVFAVTDGTELARAWASELEASSRLGNTPRFVYFPGGGALETSDNASVDRLLRQWQPRWYQGWIHRLESHLPFVILTAVAVAVFVWAMVFHGVPAAAERMAHALPAQTLNTVSRETLAMLDRLYLAPSDLPESRQAELQAEFQPVLREYADLPLRVLFRRGGERIGANAFALPDGTMIFTDELVAVSERPAELVAVLAHEVGHIHHRHSLRAMIQNSALGVGYVMLVGDSSAVAELLVGLPLVAATLSYSREHEREADRFAGDYLDRHGIERRAFVDILQRMGDSAQCRALMEKQSESEAEELTPTERADLCEELLAEHEDSGRTDWSVYLSTHPGIKERLQEFEGR